jgi:hypothetical protein
VAVQCGKEARKRRGKNPGTRSKKPEAEEELIPYQDWLIRGSNQSNRGCPTLLLLRSGDDLLPLVVHHPLFNIRSLQKFSSTRKGSLGEKANSLSAGTIEFKSLIHMLTQSRRPSHEVSFFACELRAPPVPCVLPEAFGWWWERKRWKGWHAYD